MDRREGRWLEMGGGVRKRFDGKTRMRESEKQLLELLWSGCLIIVLELCHFWLVTVVSHFCFAYDQG